MLPTRSLLALVAGAAIAPVSLAQSITTGFTGTLTTFSSPLGGGGFFSLTATDPQGITIDAIDVHCGTGTAVVGFLYRPGGYQGFEQNISAWLHLGEARFTSAGTSTPSPTTIGGLHIPQGQTYSFRQVQMAGTGRLHTEAQMAGAAVITTDEAQLDRGAAQTNGYVLSTVTSPRGWNGTIHYTLGGKPPTGACCLQDGTCAVLRADDCRFQFGTYHGDGATCAGVNCPQPGPGACCMPSAACTIEDSASCAALGGFFSGFGTDCTAAPCGTLSTPFLGPTVGAGMFNGHFFTISASDRDVIVNAFDINCSATAGTNITVRIHSRPDAWLGFTEAPDAWTVHAEVPAVSAGSEQPTRVRLPMGRHLVIPAQQTVALRVGAAGGSIRYTGTSYTPFVKDAHARVDFGATQSNLWSTISPGRTMSTNIYYTLGPEVAPPACYANCDESTVAPVLNVADFTCFLQKFAAGDAYANCDESTTPPVLNVADFTCFLQKFAAGCP